MKNKSSHSTKQINKHTNIKHPRHDTSHFYGNSAQTHQLTEEALTTVPISVRTVEEWHRVRILGACEKSPRQQVSCELSFFKT